MSKHTIFYNYQKMSSFIRQDKEILEERYQLIHFNFEPKSMFGYFLCMSKQMFVLFVNWRRYDVIVSQIAAYHTFIPSILSILKLKKHIIILHGTDCNVIPEINYGNLGKWPISWFTKKSIQMATLLLPVSDKLIDNEPKYLKYTGAKLGLKNNIANFKTPYQIVYNGLDVSKFNIIKDARPEFSFITVALGIDNQRNYFLKGIDLILEIAKLHPNYNFTFVGSDRIYGFENDLPNVKILGLVPHEKLAEIYNQHRYYLQLSMSESFGLSLCESILCGCIPIVSEVGMMPDIIEDFGHILHEKNVKHLETLIKNCIGQHVQNNLIQMEKRRSKVVSRFELVIRKEALMRVINEWT